MMANLWEKGIKVLVGNLNLSYLITTVPPFVNFEFLCVCHETNDALHNPIQSKAKYVLLNLYNYFISEQGSREK